VSADRERGSDVKQDGFYRYERRIGSFTRSITLPEGVTEDGVKASHANGVLEVRVRKPEETKPKRIEIGVSGEKTIEGTATEA
jgi:HSP20 family protein